MAGIMSKLEQLIGETVVVTNKNDERYGEVGKIIRISMTNDPDEEPEIVLEFPDGAREAFFSEEIK